MNIRHNPSHTSPAFLQDCHDTGSVGPLVLLDVDHLISGEERAVRHRTRVPDHPRGQRHHGGYPVLRHANNLESVRPTTAPPLPTLVIGRALTGLSAFS